MSMLQLELEDLMHQALPVAKQMLRDGGTVVPYGAVMRPDGEVLPVGVDTSGASLKVGDIIDTLSESMMDMARDGSCKATAVVYAVKVSLPGTDQLSDAVALSLCHKAGEAMMVFHPFHRAAGGINYGSAFAHFDQNRVFRRLH